jgi:hypothetical protein
VIAAIASIARIARIAVMPMKSAEEAVPAGIAIRLFARIAAAGRKPVPQRMPAIAPAMTTGIFTGWLAAVGLYRGALFGAAIAAPMEPIAKPIKKARAA